mgnify:CR=1 FL=1
MNGRADKGITETAARLRDEGTPHAVATVVRTIASTAAKPGMKAIILEDGAYAEGWLGGGCVTSAVRRAAQTAILTGGQPSYACGRKSFLPTRKMARIW